MANVEWMPIETAPQDGSVFLVCGHGKHGYYVADCKMLRGKFWMFDHLSDAYIFEADGHSHWMPLPPPPKQNVR